MHTREANAGDAAAILPMLRQHRLARQQGDPGLYELHPDAEPRFNRWLGRVAEDPRALMLVVEDGGRIIGFLAATIEHDMPIYLVDEFALVREWWVEPASRGTGAGKALIRAAIKTFRGAGVKQLRVRTAFHADADVRAILERNGFRAGSTDMIKPL